jgi:hypothetical protein
MKYAPNEQCTLLYQWGDQLWIGLLPWQKAPPTDHAHYLAPLNLNPRQRRQRRVMGKGIEPQVERRCRRWLGFLMMAP